MKIIDDKLVCRQVLEAASQIADGGQGNIQEVLEWPAGVFLQLERIARETTQPLFEPSLDAYNKVARDLLARELRAWHLINCYVRSGWVREKAMQALDHFDSQQVLATLMIRVGDPVPTISEQAETLLAPHVHASNIGLLVKCLKVAGRMLKQVRARSSNVLQDYWNVLRDTPSARPALWQFAVDGDRETALTVFELLLNQDHSEALVQQILEAAIEHHDPVVRGWASQLFADHKQSSEDVRAALAPRLYEDSAFQSRLAALRYYDRHDNTQRLKESVLDGNASVRFFARRFLARRDIKPAGRNEALDILQTPGNAPSRLIGALAILSESGRAEDLELIKKYTTDPRAKVRREAKRTLELVSQAVG